MSTLKDCWSGDDGKPSVVLSFDDGYHDFVEYAMPILAKHGLSANQNIIPECVISGLAPWNVRLYDFLNRAPFALIKKIRVPGFRETLKDEHDASKTRYGLALSRFLKLRPRSERAELWAFLEPIISQTASAGVRMMNISDVVQAAVHHEIGVHSFGHESMAFEDDAFFEKDFERCLRFFEKALRLPLNIYAFPNGSYRPGQVETLRRKGLRHILLVNERMAHEVDGSVLPRITIFGDTDIEVRLRALGYGGATLL